MRSGNCLLRVIPESASVLIRDRNKRGLEFSTIPGNAARFRDDEMGAA